MNILSRMEPDDSDLKARLAKLEADVAGLLAREQARSLAPGRVIPASEAVTPMATRIPAVPAPPSAIPPAAAPAPPKEHKERNPVVLVASLGAGIFLLGAIFFLSYAIQQGWIGPELRFLLGLIIGGGLTAFAAKLILGDGKRIGAAILAAGLGTLEFTFYVGAFNYHFFSPTLGLAATALAALVAGGLAARSKTQAPFAVAFLTAFIAPFAFSQGGHHEITLSLYLLVLVGASTILPYLAGLGARWALSRWMVTVLAWIVLSVISGTHLREDAGSLVLMLGLHYAFAFAFIWLPGQSEPRPSTPTLLWFLVSIAATSLGAVCWKELDFSAEWYAAPVLAFAALNLAAVKPLRERLGSRQADLGLLVLAAGHLALAVPIALAWRWVGPLWGVFALGLAWAAGKSETLPDWDGEEAAALRKLALGMALAATMRWMVQAATTWGRIFESLNPYEPFTRMPFLNSLFALSVLLSLAFVLLARRGRGYAVVGFLGLQIVANVSLAFELAYALRWSGGSAHSASVVVTLVWALSGAAQWLKSLSTEEAGFRRGLTAAGYTWLGIASFKLIAADMADATVILRAAAFLGVGVIFMGAALLGHRLKPRQDSEKSA